jgi:hypothetical protein
MQDEVTTRLAHEVYIELIAAERAAGWLASIPTDSIPSITLFTGGRLVSTSVSRVGAASTPLF